VIDISSISGSLTKSDQSLWPNCKKGLWIVLFVMFIGVLTLIDVKEESYSVFYEKKNI
jgi:hypothetical protein